MLKNYENDPIKINHSELKRYSDESAYKSDCPMCHVGILLVGRDDDFKLSENDICIACGQQFIYKDIEKLRKGEL